MSFYVDPCSRSPPAAELGALLCAVASLSAVSDEDLLPLRTSFGAFTLFVQPNTAKTLAKARELEDLLRSFDYAECGSRLAISFAASSCSSGEELVAALTKVARPLTHRCSEYIDSGERTIALCREGRVRTEACSHLEQQLREGCSRQPHHPVCPRPASCR